MSCAGVRLEEYLDGELGPDVRGEVESHLASCAPCRGELDGLRRLERLLLAAPAGAPPDAERLVAGIRARSRRGRGRWIGAAAAAAGLAAIVTLSLPERRPAIDVRAELESYARAPSAGIEARIRSAGPPGLAALERSLADPEVRIQFSAASLLFRLADGPTRERVLARFQQAREGNGGWTLADIGAEDEDLEIMPVAVNCALEGQERWAMGVLRRLYRLNPEAQGKLVDSVVQLLKMPNPRVQKLALDIVKELRIRFPLSAIVDLLDSPDVGDEALRILRRATGKDLGRDKEAWRKAIERKEDDL